MPTNAEVDAQFGAILQRWKDHPFNQPRRAEILATLLGFVGERFDQHKIVDTGDPNKAELRGRFRGLPIKIELTGMALNIEIECRIETEQWNGLLAFLRYDPNEIPTPGDPADPFAEDDDIHAFIAKGLFLTSSYPEEIDLGLAFLASLTDELRDRIVTVLSGHPVPRMLIFGDRIRANLDDATEYGENLHAFSLIVDVCDLMARCAPEILASDVVPGTRPPISFGLVRCTYCGSRFGLGPTAKCPNCGAGYEGDLGD